MYLKDGSDLEMRSYMGWGWKQVGEYRFLEGRNVNKDGGHLACLGSSHLLRDRCSRQKASSQGPPETNERIKEGTLIILVEDCSNCLGS